MSKLWERRFGDGNIRNKKAKALKESLFVGQKQVNKNKKVEKDEEAKSRLLSSMISGRHVKKETIAFHLLPPTSETQKPPANYFQKNFTTPLHMASTVFGNEFLRILSNKQYAAKNVRGVWMEDLKYILSMTKWDIHFNHIHYSDQKTIFEKIFSSKKIAEAVAKYLESKEDLSEEEKYELQDLINDQIDPREDAEFGVLDQYSGNPLMQRLIQDYSRLCGVWAVFGEADYSAFNLGISDKTMRILRIDNSPFFNCSSSLPQRIIGSSFTNDLLRMFLDQNPNVTSAAYTTQAAMNLLRTETIINQEDYNRNFGELFIRSYRHGIDNFLLESIKEKIEKDQTLKECFMEFMQGLEDALELAEDGEFLEAYSAKYRDTPFAKELDIIIETLKQNATEAKAQYALFLQHFEKLKTGKNEKYPISKEDLRKLLENERDYFLQENELMQKMAEEYSGAREQILRLDNFQKEIDSSKIEIAKLQEDLASYDKESAAQSGKMDVDDVLQDAEPKAKRVCAESQKHKEQKFDLAALKQRREYLKISFYRVKEEMLRPFIERAGEEQFAIVGEDNFIISVTEFYKFFEQEAPTKKAKQEYYEKILKEPNLEEYHQKLCGKPSASPIPDSVRQEVGQAAACGQSSVA